ncbi:hypothetical protein LA55_521 [Francisella philomiragia]|uniref:Uncharacterized protein n=1 Tax=Francisella philomiragia TaxID=28110 RepID=A0A0B6D7I3_9GAMM|nr:hypothetical protein LA55_521 [Francisella philomiragia]
MKNTTARIKFKRHLGSANQFLVTSMVALHHLKESEVNEAPEELHTTWSPQDRDSTIDRSRIFVKQSFLAWAVDGIDMYVSLLNKSPKYLQKEREQLVLDSAGRSVLKKSVLLGKELNVNPVIIALVDVLVTWRNNAIHSLAENDLMDGHDEIIQDNKSWIAENFRGLDPSLLTQKAERGDSLTFKETASLINVAHKYVEEVDRLVIGNLDKERLALEAIARETRKNLDFMRKYSSLQGGKREAMIKVWLQNNLAYPNPEPEVLSSCCDIQKVKMVNKSMQQTADAAAD